MSSTTFGQMRETIADPGRNSFGALLERITSERARLDDELQRGGAVLLRGYDLSTVQQFSEVVGALSAGDLRQYQGGASPRTAMLGGVRPIYNSTDYPADCELPLHNELSYSDDYPGRIYFMCLTEPEDGGETTLGDSRQILAAMPSLVRAAFERKGVRYIRHLWSGTGTGYSWQDVFCSDDRAEVEARCATIGADIEWLAGDVLRVVQVRPAIAVHPDTGEEVWFNQADGFHPSGLDPATYRELLQLCGSEERFRLNVTFGDGSPIGADMLSAVRDVIRRETGPHPWRKGDVLVLDNLLTAHGRRPFRGARAIATAMS